MNNRRKLLVALGAGALAAPFASFAQQQGKVWRVGFLVSGSRPANLDSHFIYGPFLQGLRERGYLGPSSRPGNLESDAQIGALLRGLRDLGYVEGKNLTMEWRYADNNAERLQGAANELAQLKVDVIVAGNTTAAHAARKSTATIPIIMASSGDPVRAGLVASLARPGGNITGLTSMSGEVGPKHLEMLLSMAPKLSRVAVLINPANSGNLELLKNVQAAARNTKAKILPVEARTVPDIEQAFSTIARENAGAVIVAPDSLFTREMRQIAERAAKQRLPSIAAAREFAQVGGLLSYGRNQGDSFRRTAAFVDKILKGAKPADLPIEQPMTFELFINGKTAKALGLKIPPSLLITAEKVIE